MKTELILYLEPTLSSPFAAQIQNYFQACRAQALDNEALKYPGHITLVGFFDDNDTQNHVLENQARSQPSSTVSRIVEFISQGISDLKAHPQDPFHLPRSTQIQDLIRPNPVAILIGIQPSEGCLQLIQAMQGAFPELGLRPKQINHLSLCYWDHPAVTSDSAGEFLFQQRSLTTNRAQELAQEYIPTLSILNTTATGTESPLQWDIVLYSIQGRDKTSPLPYPLVELKRWTL